MSSMGIDGNASTFPLYLLSFSTEFLKFQQYFFDSLGILGLAKNSRTNGSG